VIINDRLSKSEDDEDLTTIPKIPLSSSESNSNDSESHSEDDDKDATLKPITSKNPFLSDADKPEEEKDYSKTPPPIPKKPTPTEPTPKESAISKLLPVHSYKKPIPPPKPKSIQIIPKPPPSTMNPESSIEDTHLPPKPEHLFTNTSTTPSDVTGVDDPNNTQKKTAEKTKSKGFKVPQFNLPNFSMAKNTTTTTTTGTKSETNPEMLPPIQPQSEPNPFESEAKQQQNKSKRPKNPSKGMSFGFIKASTILKPFSSFTPTTTTQKTETEADEQKISKESEEENREDSDSQGSRSQEL